MRKPNKKNHGGDMMTVPGPILKRLVGYFVVVAILGLGLSGCASHWLSPSPIHVSFYDKETGEPLTNGYAVVTRGRVTDSGGSLVGPHPAPKQTKNGPETLHKINEDGEITVDRMGNWTMGMKVFVSGQ